MSIEFACENVNRHFLRSRVSDDAEVLRQTLRIDRVHYSKYFSHRDQDPMKCNAIRSAGNRHFSHPHDYIICNGLQVCQNLHSRNAQEKNPTRHKNQNLIENI